MISNTTYKLLAAAMISTLLVVGCQKEDKDPVSVKPSTNGLLTFGISQNDGWNSSATKANGLPVTKGETFRSDALVMDCEDGDLPFGDVYIYMVEEDIPDAESQENVLTRADDEDPATGETPSEGETPSDGDVVVPDTRTYGVFAYQGVGEVPTSYVASTDVSEFAEIQNLLIDAQGKYEGQDQGREIYAPGAGTWLYFYTYGPYMSVTAEGSTANPALRENGKFPYIEYEATSDLAKTTDLLFGGSAAPQSGEVNDSIKLSVSHILSNVRIDTASIGSGRISSIALKNIYSKGTFNSENTKVWTLASTQADYSKTAETGSVEFDDLFLLPQALADDAIIEIKVEVTTAGSETMSAITREYVLTKNLKAFIAEWKPNKRYTYTISTPHEVEVEVTDEIVKNGSYPVKQNLQIKNCGLADAYIRVMISGAWVVDETINGKVQPVVVADWKNTGDVTTDDGEFVWQSTKPVHGKCNAEGWRCCEDGFFYYMNKTVPGEIIPTLFKSYTLKASPPVAGAYLELTILAQGVYASDIDLIFPQEILSDVPTYLGPNPHK